MLRWHVVVQRAADVNRILRSEPSWRLLEGEAMIP